MTKLTTTEKRQLLREISFIPLKPNETAETATRLYQQYIDEQTDERIEEMWAEVTRPITELMLYGETWWRKDDT